MLAVIAVVTTVLIVGCGGGMGPTLPSPDRTPTNDAPVNDTPTNDTPTNDVRSDVEQITLRPGEYLSPGLFYI